MQYQLSADGQTLTAYTDDVNNPVFVATLLDPVAGEADSTINYDFTLYQALDQLDSNGNRQDPLPVPLRLRTEDSDGDVVNLNLGIEISDADDPAAVIIDTLDVSELPAKNGSHLTGTDSVDVDITASEDPVVEVAFQVGKRHQCHGCRWPAGYPEWRPAAMVCGQQPDPGSPGQWPDSAAFYAAVGCGNCVGAPVVPCRLDLEILGPVDHLDSGPDVPDYPGWRPLMRMAAWPWPMWPWTLLTGGIPPCTPPPPGGAG